MLDTPTTTAILKLDGLMRTFKQGEREIAVLNGASAAIYPGESVALVGPSGAGKSTLLHIAGLLETPTAGSVIMGGRDCSKLGDDERTRIRRINARLESTDPRIGAKRTRQWQPIRTPPRTRRAEHHAYDRNE